jgi:plastocyanin
LWQWQTGAGADAPAITYEIDGTQYVAIAAGGVSIQTTSQNGDMVWVFSLAGSPGDRLRPFAPPTPPDTVVGFVGPVVKAQSVQLEDYRFNPARITVPTGTKVTFSNAGTQPHNASSSDGGGWDTGLLARGETATVTFNKPGTYSFTCTPHPSMIGQIIVTGPALASAPTTVVDTAAKSTAAPQDHGAH